jgi:uncharacterized protein (TIGR03067 family)
MKSINDVALDRAGLTVFRDTTFLAAGPQVNAVVRRRRLRSGARPRYARRAHHFRRSTMLYHGSVVVLAGLLVASGPAVPSKELPEAAKKELRALEGKWRVVKFVHSDRETTPGEGDDAVVVEFKDNTIDFAGSSTCVVADLDPATDPKCLDFKGPFKKDMIYESVYKRDGDTLTWAVYHGQGKNRPTAFDKPTDAGVMVMVLTRVKQ